ncbi:hypothetical protein [Vibrio cholerae]|uniref:hypothetical protein n=3 Tax=Vibrio TaxID=662 RepID=UPI000BA97488|nr:hypothetical protein [Vibrio cholerae]EIA3113423.1 hypothetical protein [Vibrio cholerae]ELF5326266.1 hypothetical protein [Vibrio cholerae]PAS26344.1 hypothetical protein CGT74_01395 [Vibrio cholerae]PAS27266.1 hypothetical protein CGT78_06675 [Vibrio cholerae]HDL9494203.1 hypothetical protein [Vibrio cholerae]
MKISYRNNSVIFMAALCSLIPLLKTTIIAKVLNFIDLSLYFTHISVLALVSPIFTFAIVDYIYRRDNNSIDNALFFQVICNSTSLFSSIFLFIYFNYALSIDSILIYIFIFDVILTSAFNNFLKYFRVKFEPSFVYKITLTRSAIDVFILFCFSISYQLSIYNVLSSSILSFFVMLCFLSYSYLASSNGKLLLSLKFTYNTLKGNIKEWFSYFTLVTLSSFSAYFDKIFAQRLLSEKDFIDFNFFTFTRAIILSASAFLFTLYYKRSSELQNNGEWILFISKCVRISFLLFILFFIINLSYLLFYFGQTSVIDLAISYFFNILFFSFFIDLFVFIRGSSFLRYFYSISYLILFFISSAFFMRVMDINFNALSLCLVMLFSKFVSVFVSSFFVYKELK